MDIEFARTFLKVVDTGSFVGAAKTLHITQAAVSRRISTLESYLGCDLFIRNKSGASLTPAGQQFLRYAASMVQTLERARHEVGVARTFKGALTLGGRFGLWDGLLVPWLKEMTEEFPDVQLRAQIGFEEGLMQDLVDGSMDIGVMYTPQSRPSLQVEPLLKEQLILVTSDPSEIQAPSPDRYVHVDWGPEFLTQLTGAFPELSSPRVIVGISWMGLQHILKTHGSGFFPSRLVQTYIQQGRLFRVEAAASFELPAYVVYPSKPQNPLTLPMLEALHRKALAVTEG